MFQCLNQYVMTKKKVFVCDDNPSIVEVIKVILSECLDLDVLTEAKSINALSYMEQEFPEILIVDLSMPGMPGDQLIKKVRGHDIFKDLFIICISANSGGKKVAVDAGADIFLAKPFNLVDLIKSVEGYEAHRKRWHMSNDNTIMN